MSRFERDGSLTIADLQYDRNTIINQNSQVFDDLVEMTESEFEVDRLNRRSNLRKGASIRHRKSKSLIGNEKEISAIIPPVKRILPRRHSSYEPRQRDVAHEAHTKMQEELIMGTDDPIEKLIELTKSINLTSMNDLGTADSSPESHRSCPALSVLSYLSDDDDDSIVLSTCRKNLGTSLDVLPEEGAESWTKKWENMAEKEDESIKTLQTEYSTSIMELPEEDPFERGRLRRKNRARSCTMLSSRLAKESPRHVVRSLSSSMYF